MDSLASFIGWVVIIGGGLLAFVLLSDHLQREKAREINRRLTIKVTAYRLALRRLYQQAPDEATKESIKQWTNNNGLTGGWALLDLQASDEKFRENNWNLGVFEAQQEIEEKGYPVCLDDGKFITRW